MKKIEKVILELSDGEKLTLPPGGSINVHCFHGYKKTVKEDHYLCGSNGRKGFMIHSFPEPFPDSFKEKISSILDDVQGMLDT